MTTEIRARLVVLTGLAVLGVALAGVGTAIGVASSVTNSGSAVQFVVTEENVSVSNGSQTETVVDDLSNVRTITIDETASGRFTVNTEEERPLTDSERERAREIALRNQTVRQRIEPMAEYELVVEPVQELNVSSAQLGHYNTTVAVEGEEASEFTVTTENTTTEDQEGSVTLVREPRTSFVEDRAVVRIRQPGESERQGLRYTVDVDLSNGNVTGITDWDEIRHHSNSIDVAEETTDSTEDAG